MKKNKNILILIAAMTLFILPCFAQSNDKDSISYPYVNTPNHNAITPQIQTTLDAPKIMRDTAKHNGKDSTRNKISPNPDGKYPDSRSRETPKKIN